MSSTRSFGGAHQSDSYAIGRAARKSSPELTVPIDARILYRSARLRLGRRAPDRLARIAGHPVFGVGRIPSSRHLRSRSGTGCPGATPENLYSSVTRLIEEELDGANGSLFRMDSTSSPARSRSPPVPIPSTELPATLRWRSKIVIKRVEARLPRAVMQQGILMEEASSAVLQIVTLRATDGKLLDEVGLGDFMRARYPG